MLTGTTAILHAERHNLPLAAYGRPAGEFPTSAPVPSLDAAHAREFDPERIYLPEIDLYGTHLEGTTEACLCWSRLGVVQVLYRVPVSSYAEGRHLAQVLHQEATDRLPLVLLPRDVYLEAQRVREWARLTRWTEEQVAAEAKELAEEAAIQAEDSVLAEENRVSAAALDVENELLDRLSRHERDHAGPDQKLPLRTRAEALALAPKMFGSTDPIEAIAEKLRPHGRVVVRRYQTTVEIGLSRLDGDGVAISHGVAILHEGRLVNVIGGELAGILGVPVGPQGADDDEREEAAHLDPGCWCGHSREMHQDGTGVCAYCVKTLSGYGLTDKRFEVRHDGCASFRPKD